METKKTNELQWYAVYTRSRTEKKVFQDLEEIGIEAYLPLEKRLKKWSDRTKWVNEPLIRSYVFVHVDKAGYHKVLDVRDVVKYICFEGKAVSIPKNQIENIKRTLENKLDYELSNRSFKPGQKVEIKHGSMQGVKGEIVKISGKKQLLLRIGEIGYSLVVNIPATYLV